MKTFSISEAKRQLGNVADLALQGEHVVIVRKSRLLVLQTLNLPEPIALRPPGYFNDCYGSTEIRESNRLARHSPRRVIP